MHMWQYAHENTVRCAMVCDMHFEKKCQHIAGFLQLGALYATITHNPRSEYNWQKSQHSECQQSQGVWECSATPVGSKEHLDWLKVDVNAAEIITIQDYKYKTLM